MSDKGRVISGDWRVTPAQLDEAWDAMEVAFNAKLVELGVGQLPDGIRLMRGLEQVKRQKP